MTSIQGHGIYFIQVGNYGYVGQTKNYNNRLGSHIRQAYYGSDRGSAQEIYGKMKIHRIQDITITLYPASSNFGIPDFENKLTQFLSEGKPAGKRVSHTGNIDDEDLRMDFAEIYHILYHYTQKDCKLTNIEVGGQIAGGTSVQQETHTMLSKTGGAIKLITRQTPPGEAYQTFLRGALESASLADLTEQIYKDVFDENWKEIVNKKYRPLIVKYYSVDKWRSLVKELTGKLKSGTEFFEEDLLPNYIMQQIPEGMEESLGKNKVKTITSVRSVAKKRIGDYINEHFLKPRKKLVESMFGALFESAGKTPTTSMKFVEQHLNFEQLGEYLADAVKNIIIQSEDSFGVTTNKGHLTQQAKLKPIRTSVVGDTHYKKNHSQTKWIHDLAINTHAEQVSNDGLKHRSVLLFDYLMDKARETDVYVEPRKSSVGENRYYVPMYFLEHANGLSARLNKVYAEYAPGYTANGFEFYRPMVSLGRSNNKRPSFEVMKKYDTDYLVYESEEEDALIVYTNIKNFVDDITNLSEIKIY